MSDTRIISEDEGRQILETHWGRLRFCYAWAWEQWEELPPEKRIPLGARSRASFIHDYATYRARKEFDGVPGVDVVDDHGFLVLVFEDTVILRFKKFRNAGMGTSGIATRQQQQFEWQDPIPGMPVATNLVSGYSLDQLQTSMSMVAIACSVGSDLQWSIDITENEDTGGAVVQPMQPGGPSGPRISSTSDENKDAAKPSSG